MFITNFMLGKLRASIYVAVGASARSLAENAIAIGGALGANDGSGSTVPLTNQNTDTETRASGASSIAMGTSARANSENDVAVGALSVAEGGSAVAIGAQSRAAANSVALGSQSVAATGAEAGYTARFLTDARSAAGQVSVGSPDALRTISSVAPGETANDAVNVEQVNSIKSDINGKLQGNLQYDAGTSTWNARHDGDPKKIVNVAAGTNSSDLINMTQLNNLDTSVTSKQTDGVIKYTSATLSWDAVFNGANKQIVNVAAGTEADDAVNVAQLNEVKTSVAGASDNLMQFDTATGEWNGARAGVNQRITNIQDGTLSADSTDLVTGRQLYMAFGDSTEAAQEANGRGGRYARTNDNGLVNADNTSDAHATGSGSTAAGFEATASGNDSLAIGHSAMATASNSIALGVNASSSMVARGSYTAYMLNTPQSNAGQLALNNLQVTGVAAGSADSDAVNVSQLRAVQNQLNQATADAFSGGTSLSGNVLTANAGGPPVRVANIAAGQGDNDLVNVGQLKDQMARIGTESNAYVDSLAGGAMQKNLDAASDRVKADIAAGMAAAGLPMPSGAGHSLVGVSSSYFGNQSGFALGYLSMLGKWAYRVAATATSKGNLGGTVGLSRTW